MWIVGFRSGEDNVNGYYVSDVFFNELYKVRDIEYWFILVNIKDMNREDFNKMI